MNLRIRYKKLGGHYHVHFWTGKAKHLTHAKHGELIFDEEEWPEIRDCIVKRGFGDTLEMFDDTEGSC